MPLVYVIFVCIYNTYPAQIRNNHAFVYIYIYIYICLYIFIIYIQKQPPEQRCSLGKGILRNFAKFTGKQLWPATLFKK